MEKNKKKLLILAGVILAIIVLIIADKAYKDHVKEQEKTAQNVTETSDDSTESAGEGLESELGTEDETSENSGAESESGETTSNEAESGEDVTTSEQNISYERWLAAGAVTGVSMYYMDFELEAIYLASETPLGNHGDSKGVYVVFKSGGETLCIESKPLDAERDEAGTIDLSTENFGFATFDVVDVKASDLEKYEEVRLENLSSLINQLMLVTLYEH